MRWVLRVRSSEQQPPKSPKIKEKKVVLLARARLVILQVNAWANDAEVMKEEIFELIQPLKDCLRECPAPRATPRMRMNETLLPDLASRLLGRLLCNSDVTSQASPDLWTGMLHALCHRMTNMRALFNHSGGFRPKTGDSVVVVGSAAPQARTANFVDPEAVVAQRLQRGLVSGQVPDGVSSPQALDQFLGYAAQLSGGDYKKGAQALELAIHTLPADMPPQFSFSRHSIRERSQVLGAAQRSGVPRLPQLQVLQPNQMRPQDTSPQGTTDWEDLLRGSRNIDRFTGFRQEVTRAKATIEARSAKIQEVIDDHPHVTVDRIVVGTGSAGAYHTRLVSAESSPHVTEGMPSVLAIGNIGFYDNEAFHFGQTPILNSPPHGVGFESASSHSAQQAQVAHGGPVRMQGRITGRTFGDVAARNLGVAMHNNPEKGVLRGHIEGSIETRPAAADDTWLDPNAKYRVQVGDKHIYANHIDIATGVGEGIIPPHGPAPSAELTQRRGFVISDQDFTALTQSGRLTTGEKMIKNGHKGVANGSFEDGVIVIGGGIIGFNAVEHVTAQKPNPSGAKVTWIGSSRSGIDTAKGMGHYIAPYVAQIDEASPTNMSGQLRIRNQNVKSIAAGNTQGVHQDAKVTVTLADDTQIVANQVVYTTGIQPSAGQNALFQDLGGGWSAQVDDATQRPLALQNEAGDVRIIGASMDVFAPKLLGRGTPALQDYTASRNAYYATVPQEGSATVGLTTLLGSIAMLDGHTDARANTASREQLQAAFAGTERADAFVNDFIAARRSPEHPNGFESRGSFEDWARAWVQGQEGIDDPAPYLEGGQNLQFYRRDVPDYRL